MIMGYAYAKNLLECLGKESIRSTGIADREEWNNNIQNSGDRDEIEKQDDGAMIKIMKCKYASFILFQKHSELLYAKVFCF